MYEKLEKCPVCGKQELTNIMICKDHLQSGESFAINECSACSFRFTNPRPLISELGKYYQSEDYISHTSKNNSLINALYKITRTFTLRQKINLIQKYSPPGRILDVGCGTGEFLEICKKYNWEIRGVENNNKAKNKAEELLNIKIQEDILSIDKEESFDVITLWHVLEHMPAIHDTIRYLKSLLDKKGTLLIALPNYNSYDAKKYKEFWAAYDVPRHLYHFNQESFKSFIKQHDLKIKNIVPMKLDAFYISYLSEKYKGKKFTSYINSLLTGLKSNSYAKKHNNNYSSLIYILKK